MRRAARIDSNQPLIVDALRAHGYSVAITSALGKGFPDIVASKESSAKHGLPVNILFEIKDGSKPPSAQLLTADELEFHSKWQGPIFVVNSINQALQIMLDA